MAPQQPHPFGGPFKCISHCILSPSRKYSNGHCKAKAVDERNSSGVLMQVVAQYPVYSNKKAEVIRLKLTLTRTTSLLLLQSRLQLYHHLSEVPFYDDWTGEYAYALSPATRPKTTHSNKELPPNLLPPCRPPGTHTTQNPTRSTHQVNHLE